MPWWHTAHYVLLMGVSEHAHPAGIMAGVACTVLVEHGQRSRRYLAASPLHCLQGYGLRQHMPYHATAAAAVSGGSRYPTQNFMRSGAAQTYWCGRSPLDHCRSSTHSLSNRPYLPVGRALTVQEIREIVVLASWALSESRPT